MDHARTVVVAKSVGHAPAQVDHVEREAEIPEPQLHIREDVLRHVVPLDRGVLGMRRVGKAKKAQTHRRGKEE